jgi:gamma-glutamyltranspeptidase/glutathione hydrolase
MLNILSGFDLARMDEAVRLHIAAEAMRLAFRDRALHLGDADFTRSPFERLLSVEHARALRPRIDPDRAADSLDLAEGLTIQVIEEDETAGERDEGKRQTTHFSIMDADGNMVASTTTLEQTFGCKAVAGATGVLMNNEMHDFNVRPGWTADDGTIGTEPNLIAPGKRMLSSMCPVILLRDGAPLAVLGSPGGRTIINTVLLVLVNIAELGMSPEEAVAAARIHHQWLPDRLFVEKRLSEAIRIELEEKGHTLKEREYQGDCHIIVVDQGTGLMTGVADRRIDGHAAAVR